jgi:putative FmdB family regulatory protein
MPLFEWLCRDCKHSFTGMSSIAAKDTVSCERCGSSETFTVMGNNGGFRLGAKGQVGWADNGYTDNTLGNSPAFKDKFGG